MRVKAKKTTEVLVYFTEDEAKILMGLIQNPIGKPEDEPADASRFRGELFSELKEALTR